MMCFSYNSNILMIKGSLLNSKEINLKEILILFPVEISLENLGFLWIEGVIFGTIHIDSEED